MTLIRLTCCLLLFIVSSEVRAADDAKPTGSTDVLPPDAELVEIWNDGEFTEGVAASPDGTIYFSDIAFQADKPGRILRYDPRTGKTVVAVTDSGQSNGLMFDPQGRLIACCGANHGLQAICEVTAAGKMKVLVDKFDGKTLNSPNDLVILSNGTIYFSDPRYVGPEPLEMDQQSVYRLTTDGKLDRVTTIDIIEKPNGVIASPDEKTLYVAETNNGSVDVTADGADVKRGRMTLNALTINPDGTLTDKKVLVDFGDELGTDGMTVDRDGRIYAAVRSDSRHGIVVFSSSGEELAYIPTEELPTNCTFGIGRDAHTLYITAGGGLYKIRLKTVGFHSFLKS